MENVVSQYRIAKHVLSLPVSSIGTTIICCQGNENRGLNTWPLGFEAEQEVHFASRGLHVFRNVFHLRLELVLKGCIFYNKIYYLVLTERLIVRKDRLPSLSCKQHICDLKYIGYWTTYMPILPLFLLHQYLHHCSPLRCMKASEQNIFIKLSFRARQVSRALISIQYKQKNNARAYASATVLYIYI